ncbi:MAG: HAD family hydrolase [Dorea sp.]|nr:HAD family hydrolase [Dorea sp.]
MIKACIFDLDGTLTDTIDSLAYSVGETLKEMGLKPITKAQCQSFVGNGAKYLLDKSLQAAGDTDAGRLNEAMEIYGRIFDENCTYHVTAYRGIERMIEKLKEKEVKLAVLSNKPHRQTVKVAQEIFGGDVFDALQGQQEGIPRKPSPEGIYAILEKLGVSKEECLYVGDSEVDVATGTAAGTKTVSVAWGFRTEDQLRAAGASLIIRSPEELLGLI